MAPIDQEYSMKQEIAEFFKKTSVTRKACDSYAKNYLGGDVTSVVVQGVCSYTVYAGPHSNYVAQFRLKTCEFRLETMNLAGAIYGHFAPQVTFMGQIGKDVEGKEPLSIYFMSRIQGISLLDFILANSRVPENSRKWSTWRHNLVTDPARFFSLSWKAPKDIDQNYRDGLRHQYERELLALHASLPERFHRLIQDCIVTLPAIFSLPMVLLHREFGVCNIMVNEISCNLFGVVDWAEAEIAPFGLNLHSHQRLISKIDLNKGWIRYPDYFQLEETFWNTLSKEAGGFNNETLRVIKLARIAGLLLSCGFTSRLPNMPPPVPIWDDESGAYNIRDLELPLTNPATRFTDLR